ncbi:MAG TPA: hypothetical protein VEI82_02220 [Myxococcota bacterium]|nr:hypothetical protein [Myxococcota bacterium]
MRRRGLAACAFAAALLVAPVALAEEAEHAPDPTLLVFHTFGLLVLGGVLVYFAREPLRDFLRDRSDVLRRQLESARAALERAQAENAQIKARLGRIAEEHEALVRESAELAERERARAVERARAAADRVRAEAQRAADQEIERARAELQREAARLATSLAGDLLRQSLTADDERRLLAEFVERIGRAS